MTDRMTDCALRPRTTCRQMGRVPPYACRTERHAVPGRSFGISHRSDPAEHAIPMAVLNESEFDLNRDPSSGQRRFAAYPSTAGGNGSQAAPTPPSGRRLSMAEISRLPGPVADLWDVAATRAPADGVEPGGVLPPRGRARADPARPRRRGQGGLLHLPGHRPVPPARARPCASRTASGAAMTEDEREARTHGPSGRHPAP